MKEKKVITKKKTDLSGELGIEFSVSANNNRRKDYVRFYGPYELFMQVKTEEVVTKYNNIKTKLCGADKYVKSYEATKKVLLEHEVR